uniref:Alcohol dehydrogenase-like C-terminal domain-containing protein n=1 Tax=Glycine max TaxID=3847 RepID=A0A0R0GCH2_SOYBN
MMANQGSLRMDNPYTISWEPLHSVNTLLSMLDVLQRSTLLLHLTKFVFSVVEFAQAAEGARVSGASRIIGVDLVSARFEEAKKFGVNEFVNPKDHDKPVQQVIAEMTNGGVDRAVECTGSIQAMVSAFECVHDGWGLAVLVGVPSKDDAFKTAPINFLNERTLKGTFYGNYKPRTDLPSVVEKYMSGELEVDKFITHTVPFSEINKAFDLMLKGQSIRCIIRMQE